MLQEEAYEGREEVDCLAHVERIQVHVGGGEWCQEVRVGVTGQGSVNGQFYEDVDRGPYLV